MKGLALVVFAGTSLPCLAQTTWVVNAAGGGNFTAIQPAIVAASPGDRIVVQGAGPYAAFALDKGLDVEAVAGAVCLTIEVIGVPFGQAARVAGFSVDQQNNGFVSVRNCSGAVLLSALGLAGTSPVMLAGKPGLELVASANVFVDRGAYLGHAGLAAGGAGVLVDGSRVTLVGTTVTGGLLVSFFPSSGNSGLAGVEVVNQGHVTLSSVLAKGGDATQGTMVGGTAGDGISTATAGAALVLGGCELRGGSFLGNQNGPAARGNVRYTVDTMLIGPVAGATLIPTRPQLVMNPTTPIGTPLVVTAYGGAGQIVVVGLDLAHQYVPLPQFDGALTLTAGAPLFALLALNGGGIGTLSVGIPNTLAAANQNVFAQCLADVGGSLVLTAPAVTRTQ